MKLFAVILLAAAAFAMACGAEATPPPSATPTPAPGSHFATATPRPTATAAVTPTLTPRATATPAPTSTPEPAASAGTPGTSIIAFPTATPAPTITPAPPAPTATPAPTARPGGTAGDPDICYRTPHVQEAILELLNVNLCVMVSPRELFRIQRFEISDVRHPDDLAGFANLYVLEYDGMLDYLNLDHTPELRGLYLNKITRWPDGYAIPSLPNLVGLRIEMRGEAACQIFRQGAVEQIFANWMDRLNDLSEFRLYIRPPYGVVPDDSESRYAAELAIANALEYDVEGLVEERMEDQYGEGWRERWDQEGLARRMNEARASVVQRVVDVSLSSDSPQCQP